MRVIFCPPYVFYHEVLSFITQLDDIEEKDKKIYLAETYQQLGTLAEEDSRDYQTAKDYYQKALDIFVEHNELRCQAKSYGQLGIIAQNSREYLQAINYYQQALEILIEYSDRYSQASTYFQLGKVAEELAELEQAKSYYLKDLEITAESNDEQGLRITIRNLARFYRETGDNSLVQSIAAMFDSTETEVRELLTVNRINDRFNESES